MGEPAGKRAIGPGGGAGLFLLLLTFAMLLGILLRHVFGVSFTALDESFLYFHAAILLLGAAPALVKDAHVRVDILYTSYSDRWRRFVNILGTVFLAIPPLIVLVHSAWPFFQRSWQMREGSPELDGIQAVFLLKGLVLLFAVLLLLQCFIMLLKILLGDQWAKGNRVEG